MRLNIDVPDYSPETGLRLDWDLGFTLGAYLERGEVVIRANNAGLISLARHLLGMVQPELPAGYHFHLDPSASLEDDSLPLTVEKIPT